MIHIVLSKKTKLFDVKYISSKGNYLSGTDPQAYENKSGCFTEIRSEMKHCFGMNGSSVVIVQDDTTTPITMYRLGLKTKVIAPDVKPKKRYQPK